MPHASRRHEQRSSPRQWCRNSRNSASTDEVQVQARDASAGGRQGIERAFPQATGPAGISRTDKIKEVSRMFTKHIETNQATAVMESQDRSRVAVSRVTMV